MLIKLLIFPLIFCFLCSLMHTQSNTFLDHVSIYMRQINVLSKMSLIHCSLLAHQWFNLTDHRKNVTQDSQLWFKQIHRQQPVQNEGMGNVCFAWGAAEMWTGKVLGPCHLVREGEAKQKITFLLKHLYCFRLKHVKSQT